MFPYSSFQKDIVNNQLVTVAFSKYSYVLSFESFTATITGDSYLMDNNSKVLITLSLDSLVQDIGYLNETLLLKLLKIQEFDKTDKYPFGYMIFYFENDIEILVEFSQMYESVVLTFTTKDGPSVWVF